VFLALRIALFALSVPGVGLIPQLESISVPGWAAPHAAGGWQTLFTATERQDALWFLRIAASGYRPGDGSAAFFPLYPMAVRAVAWLPGLGPLGAALLVSNLSFLGALFVLHGLTREEFGGDAAFARRSILYLAIFPTSFFFLAPYSESLFLLLSLVAIRAARSRQWLRSGSAGALAALTRVIGVTLVPAIGVEAIQQAIDERRSAVRGLVAAACVLLGPIAYLALWEITRSSGAAPLDAQSGWGRVASFPLLTLYDGLESAVRFRSYWMIDFAVVAVVIVASVSALRWMRPLYSVYCLSSLVIPLAYPFPDRPLLSMPRFVAVLFPVAWVFARATSRGRLPEALVVGVSAAGWAILGLLFMNWHYIF
jgi:hypothetical protein